MEEGSVRNEMKKLLGTKSSCHRVLCLPVCPRAWLSVYTAQVYLLQRAASVYSSREFVPQAIKYLLGTWYISLPTFCLYFIHPSLWCSVIKWHKENLKKKNLQCIHRQTFLLVKSEIERHHSISNLNTVPCIWIKQTSVRIMESPLKGNGVYLLIFVLGECTLHDDMFFRDYTSWCL